MRINRFIGKKLFIVYVKWNYSQNDWKLIHTTVKRTIRMSVRSVYIHDGATWSRENWVNDVYLHDGAILAASWPCSTDAISLDDLFLALYNCLNAILTARKLTFLSFNLTLYYLFTMQDSREARSRILCWSGAAETTDRQRSSRKYSLVVGGSNSNRVAAKWVGARPVNSLN